MGIPTTLCKILDNATQNCLPTKFSLILQNYFYLKGISLSHDMQRKLIMAKTLNI